MQVVRDGFGRRCHIAAHASPYATLLALGDRLAVHAQTPRALANNLAFLQAELSDPAFHRLARTQSRTLRGEIRSLIRDAVPLGELIECDADKVARALQATINGSLLQWAIERDGKLAPWIRANVTAVLRPLVRERRSRGKR